MEEKKWIDSIMNMIMDNIALSSMDVRFHFCKETPFQLELKELRQRLENGCELIYAK